MNMTSSHGTYLSTGTTLKCRLWVSGFKSIKSHRNYKFCITYTNKTFWDGPV